MNYLVKAYNMRNKCVLVCVSLQQANELPNVISNKRINFKITYCCFGILTSKRLSSRLCWLLHVYITREDANRDEKEFDLQHGYGFVLILHFFI